MGQTNEVEQNADIKDISKQIKPEKIIMYSETKNELIKKYGEPSKITKNGEPFFSHSYKEDCRLMAGLKYSFDERLEWELLNGKFIVVYFNNGEKEPTVIFDGTAS